MDSLTLKLKDNWFIIVFSASMIVWYANTTTRLEALETKVEDQRTINDKINQINIDVAVIKANVEFIKNRLK